MKKIYLCLLLITHIASTSCMERLPIPFFYHPLYESTIKNPLNTVSQTSQNTVPVYIEANEPGWQQLNDIMNMTYKRDQPAVITNSTELVPVYQPITHKNNYASTKKSITRKEKKPLLKTVTPVQPDAALMQQLYTCAYDLVYNAQNNTTVSPTDHHNNLAQMIKSMNNARDKGINEDLMGKFAYGKQLSESSFDQLVYENNNRKAYTTLFFSCLKRYTLTVKKTLETHPFNYEPHKPTLSEIFNTSSYEDKKCDSYSLSKAPIKLAKLKTDNAFICLEYVLRSLVKTYGSQTTGHLTHCLYGTQPPVKLYTQKSSIDLKNKFYDKAYGLLFNNGNGEDVIDILTIIETAKIHRDINDENDLGYGILGFEPTNTLIKTINTYLYEQPSTVNAKKRIALLCTLIEKYNSTRLKKVTPTTTQHCAYDLYKDLDLALPDSCKCIQLNKQHYAFVELKQLVEDIRILMCAHNKDVAEQADRLYPQKK